MSPDKSSKKTKLKTGKKRTARQVEPVIVQVLVTRPTKALRQLVAGPSQVPEVRVTSKTDGRWFSEFVINRFENIWVTSPDVIPRLDQVGLDDEVITKMLAILPESTRRSFLAEILRKLESLVGKDRSEAPDGVKQLMLHLDEHRPINALSLCRLVEDETSFGWISKNTQLHLGPSSQARLRELARVLRGVYRPVPDELIPEPELKPSDPFTATVVTRFCSQEVTVATQEAILLLLELLRMAKADSDDPLLQQLQPYAGREIDVSEFITVVDIIKDRSTADLRRYGMDWTSIASTLLLDLSTDLADATIV